jgi:type I restriction enzyme R subunit
VLNLDVPVLLSANRLFHQLLVNGVPVEYQKKGETRGDFVGLIDFANVSANEWLTGFDAPCVHTLYVDKPMKGHNLMQAIARVNRVFRDKEGGLVVDYIGIANDLKQALKEYTASRGRGRPTVDAHEVYAVLEEKLDVLRAMLHGFDYGGFFTGGHGLLARAANHVLGIKDGKKRFADAVLAMSKAFSLCCTLDEAKAAREEVAFSRPSRSCSPSSISATGKRPMRNANWRSGKSLAPPSYRPTWWISSVRPDWTSPTSASWTTISCKR